MAVLVPRSIMSMLSINKRLLAFYILSILVLCSNIYAGEFVFDHNGKNIKLPSTQINDNEYIRLSSFLEPLSIKPVYNRVLHKISFKNSKDIFILSPISDAVAINGDVLMFEKPLVVHKGVSYLSRPAAISFATKLSYSVKKRTVMIDPGHGGSGDDGLGAKAEFNGKTIYEKNITLSFAKKLGELLQNNGYIVYYTRTNDKKIPLAERTSTANNDGTNIFISVHANSSVDPMARGADVFYMSEEAEDTYAEMVAKKENTLLANNKNKKDVDSVLSSIMTSGHIKESARLAYNISSRIPVKMVNRGVKKAPFAVLHSAYMPSVLIEIGFMSNASDLSDMLNEEWIEKMTKNISKGIDLYFINSKEE